MLDWPVRVAHVLFTQAYQGIRRTIVNQPSAFYNRS